MHEASQGAPRCSRGAGTDPLRDRTESDAAVGAASSNPSGARDRAAGSEASGSDGSTSGAAGRATCDRVLCVLSGPHAEIASRPAPLTTPAISAKKRNVLSPARAGGAPLRGDGRSTGVTIHSGALLRSGEFVIAATPPVVATSVGAIRKVPSAGRCAGDSACAMRQR